MGRLALKGGEPVRKKPFPSWPVWGEEEKQALLRVLESRKWGRHVGKEVEEFEAQFARFNGVRYGVAVANGTCALEIALKACGIKGGDEVIIPPYTFVATATSVLVLNALPVFVDIHPDTLLIDPERIKEAITERTRAIIPVHIGGNVCNMDEILEIAKEYNLKVIEDACQAHGAEWRGKKAGTLGDAGCFSFQLGKNMTSGEGGMVLTNDKEIAEKAWALHTCGRRRLGDWYEHIYLGWNYRMTEFQGAILKEQLKRLPSHLSKRKVNAEYLDRRLREIEGIEPLKKDERVTTHAYHLYIFKYKKEKFGGLEKEKFLKALSAEGIPCGGGYIPIYKYPFFKEDLDAFRFSPKGREYSVERCEEAEKASQEVVWLPQYLLLGEEEDMEDIVKAIKKIQDNFNELT